MEKPGVVTRCGNFEPSQVRGRARPHGNRHGDHRRPNDRSRKSPQTPRQTLPGSSAFFKAHDRALPQENSRGLQVNILTLDWETFFTETYTLQRGKHQHTTEHYVRDPKFEPHMCGFRWCSGEFATNPPNQNW